MSKMRHEIDGNIEVGLTVLVLGRRLRIEFDVPPEVLFEQQRRLQDVIDDSVDRAIAQDALNNAPTDIRQ